MKLRGNNTCIFLDFVVKVGKGGGNMKSKIGDLLRGALGVIAAIVIIYLVFGYISHVFYG